MPTFRLPENFDPYAIIDLTADNGRTPDFARTVTELNEQCRLARSVTSASSIDLVNGIFDFFTPYLIEGFWRFIDALELRRDGMLIKYCIERVADRPDELDEVTCALLLLSFAHPCTRALHDDQKLHKSWYGSIMMAVSLWKKLTEQRPVVDTLKTDLLRKREEIFGRVPQWIAVNLSAFLLNVATLTTALQRQSLGDHLARFSFWKPSRLESFCYLLDEFRFHKGVPFWGERDFRALYLGSSDTGCYLKQTHGAFAMIDVYIDRIADCAQKLRNSPEGNLLDGTAWRHMQDP